MGRWLVLVAVFALGCGSSSAAPDPAPQYSPLVALDAWQAVAPDEDPFVVDRDVVPDCGAPGFRLEPDQAWLEIDTTVCSWVTVTSRARFDVESGQGLRIDVSHFDLDAAAPAQARLQLRLGDCEAWSKTIPIPSEANVMRDELVSRCALRENDPIWFHLQNHGQNTYQLQGVAVLR
jgi:hypothetical protein